MVTWFPLRRCKWNSVMEYSRVFVFICVHLSSIIFCRSFPWKSLEGCQTFAVDEGRFLVSDARSFSDVLRTDVPWSSSVAVYKKFGRRKHIFHLDIQKTSRVIQTKFFNSSFTLSIFGNLWGIFWAFSDDFGRSQELVAQVAEPSKASLRAFTESLLFTWDGGFLRLKLYVTPINSN